MAPPPTDIQSSWTDGSADWSTPGDWSEGVPTGAGSSALLGGNGTYTVTIASDESFAPDSVTLDNANAVLALNGSLATIGGATIGGTTIEAGTLQDAGNLSGPELVSGGVLLGIGTSPFTLDNTITLAGGTLSWVDTQSHTADVMVPDGTVFIGAGEIEDATHLQPGYQPGTLGPTPYPVVLTNLGTIETAPSVTGNSASDELFLSNSSLINDGLIESNGGLLEIADSTFDNAAGATLEGLNSAYIDIFSPFSNAGLITATGGTLSLGGQGTWVNTGSIVADNASVLLGGDETEADYGGITLIGTSALDLDGTLENAGTTLNAGSTLLHGLTLDDGSIVEGTLDNAGLGLNLAPYTSNTLDGVTVINGLTVTGGGITLSNGSAVFSDAAAQTLATIEVGTDGTLGFTGTDDYTIGQAVSMAGGEVDLSGPFTLDSTIAGSNGTIKLGGQIGTIGTTWVNDGAVQADRANITLEGDETVAQIGSIDDTGGTLYYDAGTLENTGTLNGSDTSLLGMVLDGGTIEGGTLDPAALDLQLQSAFSEVYYLAGHLDNVSIINNFTVGGAVVLSGSTAIYADASATTPGTITVTSSGEVVFAGAGPLTLDNPVTLEGGALSWAATPTIASTLTTVDVTVAAADIVSGSGELGGEFNDSDVSLTNLGTIDANTSFETLAVDAASLSNNGLLEATDGATLVLGTLTPVYDPTTGTYDEVASSLLNSGTISLNDATLDLDTDATAAQLGSISNSNGTIVYTGGTLQNTGDTLNASDTSLLGLQLDGGTIEGGTLDVAGLGFGVSEVGYSYGQSDLDNVAILGNLSVAAPLALSGSTAVFSDTTASAPGTLTVQYGGAAVFVGSAQSTLTNTVSLVGGDLSWAAQTGYAQTTPTVAATIAADDTVSGYGLITGSPGFETSSIDLTNLGTIDADTSFDTLAVDVASLTNHGLIEASNSAVVQLGSVSDVYDPTSGSYDLVATSLVNAGSISLTDADLVLEVDATPAQLGAISNSGGTIYYAGGTLDNTGGTLNASDTSLLGLQLDGGTIEGGTLDTTGLGFGVSEQEFGYYGQSDLDNVTIINNLTVDASLKLTGTTAVYSDATATTPGTISVQSYGNLGLGGSAQYTLSNPIVLEGGTLNWIGSGNSPTVAATIAGSELVSGIGYIEDRSDTFNDSTDDLTNLGTIEATGSNFSGLWIDVSTLDNQGLIEALPSAALSINAGATDDLSNSGTISGGTLSTLDLGGSFDNTGLVTIDGGALTLGTGYDTYVPSLGSYEFVHTTFVNTGTISATDGTVVLDGNENVGDFGSLTLNDSTLLFSGVLENAGLRLDSTTPVLQDMTLAGGTIEGGVLDAGASGLAFASGVVSTLDNVAIVNDFTLNDGTAELSGSSAVYTANSETTPGNIRIANGLLAFSGAGPFTLDNSVILAGGVIGWAGASGSTASATIAAGDQVQGAGGIYDNLFNPTAPDNLTNAGTIDADVAGETLAVNPTALTNQRLMEATDAGTLSINQGFDRNWVNAAGATISGTANTELELGGSFSNAGVVNSQGGTLNLDGTFINTLDVPTVTTWTNTGTVSAFDAVVNLAGDETAADIGTLNLTQSALYYTAGTLDNTGGTLDGSSTSLLGLQLQGATILGGTIDAAALGLTFNNSTLNTLANVTLINDFTVLGGAVVLDGSTAVYADAAATQTGLITVSSGTVAFEGAGPFTLVNPVILSSGVLGWIGTSGTADVTIAQGAAVVGSGGIYSNPFVANEPGLVTNAGVIAADVSGQTLAIAPTEFANTGLVRRQVL
jgi:fibronectin-binding autotransporter adhesin